jgi:hypothetical protein
MLNLFEIVGTLSAVASSTDKQEGFLECC